MGARRPYLTLMTEDAPQRAHPLREVFNGLRWIVRDLRELLRVATGRNARPSAAIFDSWTQQSSPESGARAGYDGAKRRKGSKTHIEEHRHLGAAAPRCAEHRRRVPPLRRATGVSAGRSRHQTSRMK